MPRQSTALRGSARRFPGVRRLLDRLARVSFAFVMMNCAAVAGLVAAVRGRKVWR